MSNGWLGEAKDYVSKAVFIALNAIVLIFVVRFFVADAGIVSGTSMEPSFHDGTYIAVVKLPLFFRSPQRFETVQLVDPSNPNELLIKRIIGLPGESITFRQNKVCVSSPVEAETCLSEPYLAPGTYTRWPTDTFETVTVPAGSYFVMGDNRPVSDDSRAFGPVERQDILGTAVKL